jgi:hypothetical protein
MNDQLKRMPQRKVARMAGLLYLAYIVIFAISTVIQGRPIVWGNAAATASNILATQGLFRLGVTMELIAAMLFLLTAWVLYILFKPVDKELALLFLLLNLVGVAIECVATLIHFSALTVYQDSTLTAAASPNQLQTLGLLFLKVGGAGGMVTVLFYGAWLFPLGYLAIKSQFLPKVFGILLIADGTCLMICFFQLWFLPGYERWTYPLFPVMFIAECGFGLWLAIKGVKDAEPTRPFQI